MPLLHRLSSLWRNLFRKTQAEQELKEELVVLNPVNQRGAVEDDFTFAAFSYPMFEQLRARRQVFSGVFTAEGAGFVDMVGPEPGNQTEKANLQLVSGEYFQVLEVNAVVGRMLTTADDQTSDAHRVQC